MSDAGWAGLLTAIHDQLFACDRETRFALAGADRRLWLTVRADSVTVEIPAYDPARLATLGWQAPEDDRDLWFYEVPRAIEHVDWLCRFAVHGASLLISADPATITFREAGPDEVDETRPAPVLTVVPDPDRVAPAVSASEVPAPGASATGAAPLENAVLGDPASGNAASGDPASGDPASGDPASGLGVLGHAVAEDAASGNAASGNAASGNAASGNAASGNAASEDSVSAPSASGALEPPVRRPEIPAQRLGTPDIPVRTPEEELAALRAVLTEAVAERDLTGYLTALRTAAVCMPLLEDPSPETGVRPAVVRGADSAIFLPIFTSADGLTEFAGNGVPFIAISFNDLIDDWPEPDWGVIIDPRTDRALTLTANSLAELRSANPPDEAFVTAAAG
jgi:hypothetical protein